MNSILIIDEYRNICGKLCCHPFSKRPALNRVLSPFTIFDRNVWDTQVKLQEYLARTNVILVIYPGYTKADIIESEEDDGAVSLADGSLLERVLAGAPRFALRLRHAHRSLIVVTLLLHSLSGVSWEGLELRQDKSWGGG